MTTFNFWKDNKVAGHFKLTGTEITQKIYPWLQSKEREWLNYYSPETVIRAFITEKTGLSSTFDEQEFDDIYHVLRPALRWYLQQIKT